MELRPNIKIDQTLAILARTADATGATVELTEGQGCTFVVIAGLYTDGSHVIQFQEYKNGAWGNIAVADLQANSGAVGYDTSLGTVTIDDAAEDHARHLISYVGVGTAVRANIAIAGETTGMVYGVDVIQFRRASSYGPAGSNAAF